MKRITILLLVLFLISFETKSQDTLKKPVVALVLSGGTAKGLAHIGVIKTLEEVGIRPDIIVGTSMGSIVGGLYAMGYSSDYLEQLAITNDWYKYLSNDTDLRKLNIEEKDDFENYLFDIPIKKKKPDLGEGLVYGHELEMYLNEITYPSNKYDNFDQFPIKYRAIAVDLINA
ncbi:MAG TPA: alpha/beta hydrolase, partial [Bacteroidetes bacterium]|nr:alpha/beta hydrolase [Bacteroidota bacterium]